MSRGDRRFEAARDVCVLAEAVHDRLFGIASLADPAAALAEISDGGGIHEAVHALLRALPPRHVNGAAHCYFCGKPNTAVEFVFASTFCEAAMCSECVEVATERLAVKKDEAAGRRELEYHRATTCACTAAERYVPSCPKHGSPIPSTRQEKR
jgi:hypothetical protein